MSELFKNELGEITDTAKHNCGWLLAVFRIFVILVEMSICYFTHFVTWKHTHILNEKVELKVECGTVFIARPILRSVTVETEILSCSVKLASAEQWAILQNKLGILSSEWLTIKIAVQISSDVNSVWSRQKWA